MNNQQNSNNTLTLFSEYGYIQVSKEEFENSDNNLIKISNKNITGTIPKCRLSNQIRVNLKTLYGDRKMYTYAVKIDDKISILIKNILDEEEKLQEKDLKKKLNKYDQYRVVSTSGTIREIIPSKSFYNENIKNGEILILASPLKLSFSDIHRGQGINILNNNSTAYKQNGDEHQFAFANRGYSSGTNYCEFTLESEPDERNIMIGISLARTDYYFSQDCKGFFGYIPSE